MEDSYQHYLSSMAATTEPGNPNSQDSRYQHQPHPAQRRQGGSPLSNPYQNLGYFTGFPDPIMFQAPQAQSTRGRKKSVAGLEHVKHRRTRSGCYTCRSRRVKCDETHPVCERCRKGKRDCLYPDPTTAKGVSGSGLSKDANSQSQTASPNSSQDDEDGEGDREIKLEPILDEEEPEEPTRPPSRSLARLRRINTTSALNLQRARNRQGSETPSLEGPKSSSPSISTGTSTSFTIPFQLSDVVLQSKSSRPDYSHLPQDLQSYLTYFCEHITHYSYCMINDPDHFFPMILPSLAIQSGNTALLHAVVGFAAYHRTFQDPNGKIQEFLHYYNKSVTLLLGCLKRRDKQDIATLVTILQLATIEEYLGDWVSLRGHQKAALQIFTQLFTPQTATQSPIARMLLTWYIRFDIFVGMLGGSETNLPRDYCVAAVQYSQQQVERDQEDPGWMLELNATELRLISVDMSILYARGVRGEISGADFSEEHGRITHQLLDWRANLDPILSDPRYIVTEFRPQQPPDDIDIINPFKPGYLYDLPLFSTTILMAEWHSVMLMHKSQEIPTLLQQPTDEVQRLALATCEIFESVQLWPSAPRGALITLQACLAIATLFVPRDERYHMWIRRKYALLESLG
ncbi:fungal-specific transcription factor domain-containing protein [Xylariomycetidae sp. FL2044]|nr:fungal-specific transcription factor domain-containing protein [Xylariomycetidae sp. FL2044]